MNATEIQGIITSYKAGTRAEQNKLAKVLLKEYQPIINHLIKGQYHSKDDYNELICIAHLQLFEALHKYDNDKKTQFNTYVYYYLRAVPRIYWENKLLKHKLQQIDDLPDIEYCDTDSAIVELGIDISKILEPEELLIYNAYISKKISSTKAILVIKAKLEEYFSINS